MIVNPSNLYRGNKNLLRGGNFDASPWSWAIANNITPSTGVTGINRTTNNTALPDIFIGGGGGGSTLAMTAAIASDAPTFAQCGINVQNCLSLSCTTAVASPSASDLFFIGTAVDQADCTLISNDYFTFSFWVKSNQTGTFALRFAWNGTTQQRYVTTFSVASANTWEFKSITLLTPFAIAGADTATCGLKINFVLMAGTSFNVTANTWGVYVAQTTTGSVAGANNFFSSTSNTFKLALLQLEKGQIATPFEYRTAEEESRLMLPWAEAGYQGVYNAGQVNTTTVQAVIPYRGQKIASNSPQLFDGAGTLGSLDWTNTSGVATSRASTVFSSGKLIAVAQQTAALEYLASGSWRNDSRITLFNF